MKILHISLCVEHYNDGWDYQDNLLPVYHKKMGLDVTLITNQLEYNIKESTIMLSQNNQYNFEGVKIIRLPFKLFPLKLNKKIRYYKYFSELLTKENPDIIFLHGIHFLNILELHTYLRKNKKTLYIDGHEDFSNSARTFFSRVFIHKFIWRNIARLFEKSTSIYWGVLPRRVEFIKKVYKFDSKKVKLLEMGIDDDVLEDVQNNEELINYKKKLNIKREDFLIVTGGKLDQFKSEIIYLIKAMQRLNYSNVKLIIFGSIPPKLKMDINKIKDISSVSFIGWLDRRDTYKLYLIAQLGIFLGRHSTLWETAVACGLPLVLSDKYLSPHLNFNNNIRYINAESIDDIKQIISDLTNMDTYKKIKKNAESVERNKFFYSTIAKKSIER